MRGHFPECSRWEPAARGRRSRIVAVLSCLTAATCAGLAGTDVHAASWPPDALLVTAPAPTLIAGKRQPSIEKVRRYISAYRGGKCFFAHPMLLKPGFARIEVLASRDRLPAVQRFDRDFKAIMGFEAFIRLRLITAEQCRLATLLDRRGNDAIDSRLSILLTADRIASGGALSGKIVGARRMRLYIFGPKARLVDVTRYVIRRRGEVGFRVPGLSGAGPMILIAVRGAGLRTRAVAKADLGSILRATRRNKGAVALGFFKLQ